MAKKNKQKEDRSFILIVQAKKSEDLKKELKAYGHNFKELTTTSKLYGGNYIFFKVDFKNSSEKKALCDFCDYLNGFRDSPV